MARNPASFAKRQRELARARKRKERAERRADRKKRKADVPHRDSDEDPDLVGIIPGPQPIPWEAGEDFSGTFDPDEESRDD